MLLLGGLALPVARPAAAQNPAPLSFLMGQINLEDVFSSGGDLRQPITFELTPSGGGSIIVRTVTLDTAGNYVLEALTPGTYTVNVKGAKWLRSAPQTVPIPAAGATFNLMLHGGDANNDNSVDSSDYTILIGSFNSDATIPGSGYDPRADFTCDGMVDSNDFTILINNYNGAGAIYQINLNAAASNGQVVLLWNALPGATYNLYRSTSLAHGATPYRTGLTNTPGQATVSFTDQNVPNGAYYYQVVAVGASMGISNETPVTVSGPAPVPVAAETGNATAWEAMIGGVNTASGNRLTELPIVSWTARGGLPVSLTLANNSQGTENGPLGHRWTHSFDLTGSVDAATGNVTLHNGDGRLTTYTRSGNTFTPPPGFHSKLTSNGSGYTLVTKAQVTYQYDANLRCQSITDTNGNVITLTYAGNLLQTVTDPTGRVLRFGYTGPLLTSIQDAQLPTHRTWTLGYVSGRLATVTEPYLANDATHYYNTGYFYDNGVNDEIVSIRTRKGAQYTWQYTVDSQGRQTSQSDPVGNTTTFSYTTVTTPTATLNATIVTDPNGNSTVYAYDPNGRLVLNEDAAGYPTKTEYDTANNVTKLTDRRGNLWQFTSYDLQGNLKTALDPLLYQTTYTYNTHNRLLTLTDPNNHKTQWDYDSHDNLTKITNGNNNFTSFSVDMTTGLVNWRKNAFGTAYYYYDGNGSLLSMKDANTHTTTYQPNALGWNLSTTDANNNKTAYTYDEWGRLILTVPQLGLGQTYYSGYVDNVYDANDNLISANDPLTHATQYYYDPADRLLQKTLPNGPNGLGDTTVYRYDTYGQKGLLSYKLDGNRNYTAYTYTLRNEVSGMAYANGTSENWTYDPNGSLASHTDPNGKRVAYVYEDRNLLKQITYPADPAVTFAYYPGGQTQTMTDATGPTSYTYDGIDNPTQVVSPNGTVNYRYDAADRRDQMTLAGTGTYSYTYDRVDNLTSVNAFGTSYTYYAYDLGDRLTSEHNQDSSETQTFYDTQDRVTDIKHNSASALRLWMHYTYDLSGNVQTRTDTNYVTGTTLSTTFGYDAADQITSEAAVDGNMQVVYSRAYTYDHAGNRKTAAHNGVTDTYTYFPNSNRLQTAGNRGYTYDNAGNCQTLTVNGQKAIFTYDDENRVGKIDYPNTPALPTSQFAYNGLRQRTSKQDSSGLLKYVMDGTVPGSDVLSDGQAVYTPGIGERRGGVTRLYKFDDAGNLRAQVGYGYNAPAFLTQDAFGNTVQQAGTLTGPFGFEADAQYQTDADSGLTLVGNRYYDSAVGRFIQPDPSGQEENEYAYAKNNPISFNDRSGLTYGPNKSKDATPPAAPASPAPAKPTPSNSGATIAGVTVRGTFGDIINIKNVIESIFPNAFKFRRHHKDDQSKSPAVAPGCTPYWNNYTKQWMVISPGYEAIDDGKKIILQRIATSPPSPTPSAPPSNPPAPATPPAPGKGKL